jgi:hypothetical protein
MPLLSWCGSVGSRSRTLPRAVPMHLRSPQSEPQFLAESLLFSDAIFYRAPAARGSMAHIEKYIENQNFQANSRKKSWMKNLISAAHITSSSCLDKCNRFVSNFIPSRSTKCIFIMTRTLDPAVVTSHYSWIERPCQNRYTHFLSGCRKARTNLRPATSVSERAASSPAVSKK